MSDEALRMGAGEDDPGEAGVGLGPGDERVEPVDDPEVHEAVRRVRERRHHDAAATLLDPDLAHRP